MSKGMDLGRVRSSSMAGLASIVRFNGRSPEVQANES